MSLLTGKLISQSVTWWPATAGDGFGGDVFSAPVLLSARWEDRQETFYGALDRRELVSKAVVFLEQDVAVGDYLCRGNQTTQSNPTSVAGALKIQRYDKIPDLRNLDAVRRVVL